MHALEIAEQIYQDIQTLCLNSNDSERHEFFFNGTTLDYRLIKKRLPVNNLEEATNPLSHEAYTRLQTRLSKFKKSSPMPSPQYDTVVNFRRMIYADYASTTDEQFAFLILSIALKNKKDFSKFYVKNIENITLNEEFFSFNSKDPNDNLIQRIGIETNFNKDTLGYLIGCYSQWPEPWKEYCNRLFEYILNQLSIPKNMAPEIIDYVRLSDPSMFADILLIADRSSSQVTKFFNNKEIELPVKRDLEIPGIRSEVFEDFMLDKVKFKIQKFLLEKSLNLPATSGTKHVAL